MLPPIRVQTKLYDDSTPSSPTPTSLTLFNSVFPPVLPIQIPQPGDEAATQQFYRDVVNHLQTISQRSSLPPTPITPTQAFFLNSSPGGSPSNFNDQNQFEDAEEDDEAWSNASFSPYPNIEPHFPNRDAQQALLQSAVLNQGPPLVRPPRVATRASSRETQTLGRANSRSSQYNAVVGDKENVRFSRGAPPPLAPRPAGGQKRATLGLAIQSAGVPSFDAESNRGTSLTSKLMRKKCETKTGAHQR